MAWMVLDENEEQEFQENSIFLLPYFSAAESITFLSLQQGYNVRPLDFENVLSNGPPRWPVISKLPNNVYNYQIPATKAFCMNKAFVTLKMPQRFGKNTLLRTRRQRSYMHWSSNRQLHQVMNVVDMLCRRPNYIFWKRILNWWPKNGTGQEIQR